MRKIGFILFLIFSTICYAQSGTITWGKINTVVHDSLGTNLSNYVLKANNLSDIPNKTTARTNLDVYSTTAVNTYLNAKVNTADFPSLYKNQAWIDSQKVTITYHPAFRGNPAYYDTVITNYISGLPRTTRTNKFYYKDLSTLFPNMRQGFFLSDTTAMSNLRNIGKFNYVDYQTGSSTLVVGEYDTLASGLTEQYVFGDFNKIGKTYNTYGGVWAFGQELNIQTKGLWAFGSDNTSQKKLIPYHDRIVFWNEPLTIALSDPNDASTSYSRAHNSFQNFSTNDSTLFTWGIQKPTGQTYSNFGLWLEKGFHADGYGGLSATYQRRLINIDQSNSKHDILFNDYKTDLGSWGDVKVSNGNLEVVNGTIDADSSKAPVYAGRVIQDATHRFVSDTEKNTYNGKQVAYTNLTSIGGLANSAGWLYNNGSGTFSYTTPSKTDVGLSNVENTALSTWAGTSNITTTAIFTHSTGKNIPTTAADNFGFGSVTNPLHSITIGANASGNLNAFNFVNTDKNKNRTTLAQARDTSSYSGYYTATGKPNIYLTGFDGSDIFHIDTNKVVFTGISQATSLALGGATIGANALAVTGTAAISGNVGIGTTSPIYKLDVSGSGHYTSGVTLDAGNLVMNTPSGSAGLKIVNSSLGGNNAWTIYPVTNGSTSDLRIYDYISGSDRLTIRQGGDVGIGTSSPGSKLDVVGGITLSGQLLAASGSATAPSYAFSGDSNTGFYSAGADYLGLTLGGTLKYGFLTTGISTVRGNYYYHRQTLDTDTDGDVRTYADASGYYIQRRESGSWVTKWSQTF